jgi:hypothetical protein
VFREELIDDGDSRRIRGIGRQKPRPRRIGIFIVSKNPSSTVSIVEMSSRSRGI